MSEKKERLRAGIALLEAAATLIEQAESEFGGTTNELTIAIMHSAATDVRVATQHAVKEYDK